MSLLGIDVGTSGCKSLLFSRDGAILSSAYEGYDISSPQAGYMELDSNIVWNAVKKTISTAASRAGTDPVRALSVASMGEAVVPVGADRRIFGNSILLSDSRGNEFVESLHQAISDEECYRISGNPVGAQYGLPKLMWIKAHMPDLYRKTYKFLNWGSLVTFMLGAEPAVDYCLANRDLLFDIRREDWSQTLLAISAIDREKLPDCVAPGTAVGTVAPRIAAELGLPSPTLIAAGAHDQCANALGCGVVSPGQAMYGMGTFPTIVPIYANLMDPKTMVRVGLNTEHHAVADRYVSFIYHMGGETVKWYRDTFAAAEYQSARDNGEDIFRRLFSELSPEPGQLLVLPHFSPMGPPDFVSNSAGVVLGLTCNTERADILKAILEANAFAHKVSVDNLASIGVPLSNYTAVGGGSRSNATVQLCADVFNTEFFRPKVIEAGALGAAILAGVAGGVYESAEAAVEETVQVECRFEPQPLRAEQYRQMYEKYRELSEKMTLLTKEWVAFRRFASSKPSAT